MRGFAPKNQRQDNIFVCTAVGNSGQLTCTKLTKEDTPRGKQVQARVPVKAAAKKCDRTKPNPNDLTVLGNLQVAGDLTVGGDIIQPNAEVAAPPANFWTNGTMYQIWVPSFFNGGYRDDGTGDFRGVTTKLDYLVDLGVEAIHLTQAVKSNAGPDGFAFSDPFAVDDRWGTEEDFLELVDTAHCKGLKVIIGFSTNTYWFDHPWFVAALNGEQIYMDRFIFRQNPPFALGIFGGNLWQDVSAWFPDTVLGQEGGWFYRTRFGGPPDVNVENPDVIRYQLNAARTWIERGVDGFRLEVGLFSVISSVSQSGEWINDTDRLELWYEKFFGGLKAIKPDLLIVPEAFFLDRFDRSIRNFAQKGVDAGASYNFQLYSALRDFISYIAPVFSYNNPLSAQELLQFYSQKLLPLTNKYIDLTFLENHDLGRVMGKYGADFIPVGLVYSTTEPFTPAPANVFRIHVSSNITIPELPFGFFYFFYDANGMTVTSGPFPTSVENTDPADGIFFLGGGTDAYGPYWDFSIDIFKGNRGTDSRFGGVIVIKDGNKFSDDLSVFADDVTTIIANNKGDAFLASLAQVTELPTEDQYNFSEAFNGILFALPGSPAIFQGEELGMWGSEFSQSLRDQIPWDEDQPNQTALNNILTVQGPVESNPLYQYVREAIHARKNSPTLRRGTFKVLSLPGDKSKDPVVVLDANSNTKLDATRTIAFVRTLSGWPTYCIFNFGTPKKIELRPYNVTECGGDGYQSASQHSPQILYSNNITLPTEYSEPSCNPLIVTMGTNSSVVFTFVRAFGVPLGDNNQFAEKCDCN